MRFLHTCDSVVFRKVGENLVVVHLDTGQIAHFTVGTQPMLEFFREPATWEEFCEAAQIPLHSAESQHARAFADKLLELKFLEETNSRESNTPANTVPYARPKLLGFDKKTLAVWSALWAGSAYAS